VRLPRWGGFALSCGLQPTRYLLTDAEESKARCTKRSAAVSPAPRHAQFVSGLTDHNAANGNFCAGNSLGVGGPGRGLRTGNEPAPLRRAMASRVEPMIGWARFILLAFQVRNLSGEQRLAGCVFWWEPRVQFTVSRVLLLIGISSAAGMIH
jgi:hypothetical protein